MFRSWLWPALAFLSGVGALKASIPLQSLTLMAVGLALSCFGLVRLVLPDEAQQPRPARRPRPARLARAPRPARPSRSARVVALLRPK
ncbi:MAG TPA: hypothetical protein VHI93_09420 [Candidatus Thermoplasmatota archaeon]|nr:hypothetical protein [Candidatus Thermoplasmatota archaeon]